MTTATAAGVAERARSLAHLELRVDHLLDGLLQGDHLGITRGAGSEAGDARGYQPGDDARRIDWALSARTGSTHVRDTVADRELETWVVVDGSASLDFGTASCEKRDLALAAVASIGLLTARAGNRLGAITFDGEGSRVVPPRAGRDAVMVLLHQLDRRPRAAEGAGSGSLADALRRSRSVARRRGLVVVVSDLMDTSDWARELRAASAHHDLVVAEVADPREDELPRVGLLTLVDPETGRRSEIQTENPRLRRRFAAAAAQRRTDARAAVRAAGADHLQLSTDRDWLVDVVRFVTTRKRLR